MDNTSPVNFDEVKLTDPRYSPTCPKLGGRVMLSARAMRGKLAENDRFHQSRFYAVLISSQVGDLRRIGIGVDRFLIRHLKAERRHRSPWRFENVGPLFWRR